MLKCNTRRFICITICCMLIISLCSCDKRKNNDISNEFPSSIVNDKYSIEYEEGRYLLQLVDNTNSHLNGSAQYQPCIYFDNMDEFVNDIKTGQFSEYEIGIISTFKKDNDKIVVCDMNDLYYPIINHENIEFIVAWYGDYYYNTKLKNDSFSMRIEKSTELDYSIGVDVKSRFNEFNSYYITQDMTDDNGNRYIVYSKDAYTTKYEYYTLSDGEKIYHVYKTYHLDRPELYDDYVSETVPYEIEVHWKEDGNYFKAYLRGGIDDFTDENIKSMRMQKYIV